MSSNLSLISTLLFVLSAALGGGVIARKLRMPMVVGYIAGGILVGNLVPAVADRTLLALLGEWGMTLLLFTLGIEFSFARLRRSLGSVVWAVTAQIVLSLVIFLFVFLAIGFPFLPAVYLAAAASLSSTAVVVKLLGERGQLETLPGELATGWLVVQDLAVVPIMLLLSAFSGQREVGATIAGTLGSVTVSLVKAVFLLMVVSWLGRRGVPGLLKAVAGFKSHEIFLLTIVGLVFLAATVSFAIGLSAALGAFLAGLIIAETSQNHAVFAEIRPLRDLFSVVFFVSFGMVIPFGYLVQWGWALAGLTVVVMFVKWFLVMGLVRFLGHHRKVAFAVALSLTQMSEFGFIFASEGLSARVLTGEQYTTLVSLTFLTIFVSSPLIAQTAQLYSGFRKILRFVPRVFPEKEDTMVHAEGLHIRDHIVICGYGRVGRYIGRALEMVGIPFVVVDYNQHTVDSLRQRGVVVVYGDPADKGVLDYAQVDLARGLVIAIADRHTQEMVISNAQSLNRRIKIVCRTHYEADQKHLKALGVHTVVQPEFEAAISIVEKLLGDFGVSTEDISGKVTRLKIEHGVG